LVRLYWLSRNSSNKPDCDAQQEKQRYSGEPKGRVTTSRAAKVTCQSWSGVCWRKRSNQLRTIESPAGTDRNRLESNHRGIDGASYF